MTVSQGRGVGREDKGIKEKPQRHRQECGDYQRERGVGEIEESRGGINGDGRRLDFG